VSDWFLTLKFEEEVHWEKLKVNKTSWDQQEIFVVAFTLKRTGKVSMFASNNNSLKKMSAHRFE